MRICAALILEGIPEPQSLDVAFYLGRCCLRLGFRERALALLEQAAVAAPSSAHVQFCLGLAQANFQNFEQAELFFNRAIDLRPEDAQCYL